MIDMFIARIVSHARPDISKWPEQLWRIEVLNGAWRVHAIGWHALTAAERLERLRMIVENVAGDGHTEQIGWVASGLAFDRKEIELLDRRWRESRIPPVLQIVALDLDARDREGRRGVTTKGLAIIAGIEIEAVATDEQISDQLVLVARMILYVLQNGAPSNSRVKDHRGISRQFEYRPVGYFTANPVISFSLPPTIDTDH